MKLKASLKFELFDPIHGYLTAIARLPEGNGFKKAVKDHILSRLREEAKDPLLDSIRDQGLANRRDEINFKKLKMDTTAKLLEAREELKSQISEESMSANRVNGWEWLQHRQARRQFIKHHRLRLNALGYTIKVEPNYDIKLLHNVIEEHRSNAWYIYGYSEMTQTWSCRYQMRLHGFIACLNASSDTRNRTDRLALIEKRIATRPGDIFADEKFCQTEKKWAALQEKNMPISNHVA